MFQLLFIFLYVLVGLTAGFAGGMLGIGGGVITVPALVFIFSFLGLPQAFIMHLAIGTSLAAMVINTFSASRAHHKKEAVIWPVVKKMVLGVVVGAVLGSSFADYLSSVILEILFGIFACLLGITFFKSKQDLKQERKIPPFPVLTLITVSIAGVSNILGIGGGMFTVPFLSSWGLSEKKAIGTSVAVTFLISLIGAISYLIFGFDDTIGIIPGTIGYIYLPAFIVIGITSFFTAPLGVKAAHKISPVKLRKIFAATLLAVGLTMIFF